MKAEDIHNIQFGRSILIGSKQYPGWNKNKDGKKKKDEGETEGYKTTSVGPTEVVFKFEQFYEDYETVWGKREETDNLSQQWDKQMLRD